MPERLRLLLDRPLGASAARAVVVLASAVLLGFAAVVAAGQIDAGHPPPGEAPARPRAVVSPERDSRDATGDLGAHRRQDPQDKRGSRARRRALRTLRSHRALQHVPFRTATATIVLAGARHGAAVLRVTAPSASAARAEWRRFLHRYGDDGRAYIPVFVASARRAKTAGPSRGSGG